MKVCKINFAITSKFSDEVQLDVMPCDNCGNVLDSPYLYDQKDIFYHEENKYHLFKDRIEYIVRAHHKQKNISLVSVGKMNRLENSTKSYLLLMVQYKNKDISDDFVGCNPNHRQKLIDIILEYDELFQEPTRLPPKREYKYEIYLQWDTPLLNVGMYRLSMIENVEIKRQV